MTFYDISEAFVTTYTLLVIMAPLFRRDCLAPPVWRSSLWH